MFTLYTLDKQNILGMAKIAVIGWCAHTKLSYWPITFESVKQWVVFFRKQCQAASDIDRSCLQQHLYT